MPRLPDVTALGDRPIPRAFREPQSYRAGIADSAAAEAIAAGAREVEGANAEAGAQLAKTGAKLLATGGSLLEFIDREDRRAKAKAERERKAEQEKINRLQMESAVSYWNVENTKVISDLPGNPDHASYQRIYSERMKEAAAKAEAAISDPYTRQLFTARIADNYAINLAKAQTMARSKAKDQNRASVAAQVQANLDAAIRTPSEAERVALIDSTRGLLQASVDAEGHSAEESQRIQKNFATTLGEARLRLLPDVEQMRLINKAFGVNGDGELPSNAEVRRTGTFIDFIAPDRLVAFRREANARIKTEIAEFERIREARRQILAEQNMAKARRGQLDYAAIDKLQEDGIFKPSEWGQAQYYRDQFVKKEEELAALRGRVQGVATGQAPLLDHNNPLDKKAANVDYEATLKELGDRPPAEILDFSIGYSIKYGVVPDKVKSLIFTNLHHDDPERVLLAVDMMHRLRNANSMLIEGQFDKKDLRKGFLVKSYLDAGMDPKKAVRTATESLVTTDPVREGRRKEYDELTDKRTGVPSRRFLEQEKNEWLRSDPRIDPVMIEEFDLLARAEYEKTGDMTAARRLAIQAVDGKWGLTQVGGAHRYMKFAPEKVYGLPNLTQEANAAWMNEQLWQGITRNALPSPDQPITKERLVIVEEPRLRGRDGRPVYQVLLRDQYGGLTNVLTSKGLPFTWAPDWLGSDEFKRRTEAERRKIEDAARSREQLLGVTAGGVLAYP